MQEFYLSPKMLVVRVKRLHSDAQLPKQMTSGSAGFDLYTIKDEVLYESHPILIPCGFAIEIPKGFEGQIRPRSGGALKGITVLNSPGTIDSDYRGEVMVLLYRVRVRGNAAQLTLKIPAGTRIAQLVICPVSNVMLFETDELSATSRGEGGFGSTGAE